MANENPPPAPETQGAAPKPAVLPLPDPAAETLQAAPPSSPQAPPEAAEAAARAAAQKQEAEKASRERRTALRQVLTQEIDGELLEKIKSGSFDFDKEHDTASELPKNPVYQTMIAGLKLFFDKNLPPADLPDTLQKHWRDAVYQFVLEEVASYKWWQPGEMSFPQVKEMLETLENPDKNSKRTNLPGVGKFETWIEKSPLKADYDAWKEEREQEEADEKERQAEAIEQQEEAKQQAEATQKQQAAQKKEGVTQRVAEELEKPLAALPAAIIPGSLRQEIEQLKTDIGAESNAEALDPKIAALKSRLAELQPLKALAEDASLPADKKKELTDGLQSGKTPQETQKAYEQALAATEAERKKAEEASTGTFDWILKKVNAGVEQGKEWAKGWGEALKGAVLALLGIPLLGDLFRGWFAPKTLADLGDLKAKNMLAAQNAFQKIGLPKELADTLSGSKTSEVVARIKDPVKLAEITTDEAAQKKLVALAQQIENKGAASSTVNFGEYLAKTPEAVAIKSTAMVAAKTADAAKPAPAETAPPSQNPPPPKQS